MSRNANLRLLALLELDVITRREFEILSLRYSHGLTLSQVSLALDVSRGTVSSTIRRARQKIDIHTKKEAA